MNAIAITPCEFSLFPAFKNWGLGLSIQAIKLLLITYNSYDNIFLSCHTTYASKVRARSYKHYSRKSVPELAREE